MTILADAIDTMDPQQREACLREVSAAINPYPAPVVLLVCLYFALIALMRMSGNLGELIDDLPRLARSVIASQGDSVTRQ